jgi:ATPase subunit of ABC transporter with duplicated ATPase domains
MMYSSLLESKDLSFSHNYKDCFDSFSEQIRIKDRIALIGDNGSGKSTLLKCLLGMISPTAGTVKKSPGISLGYLAQDVTLSEEETVWDVAKSLVSDVFSDLDRFDELSLSSEASEEYEELLQKLVDSDAFSLEAYLKELLDRADLLKYRTEYIRSLSGGERMRLALVSVLASRPDILFFDEPTNHLDHQQRRWLFDFLDSWSGAAVIISHDKDLLDRWPTKIWHIDKGKVRIFEGSYLDYQCERKIELEQRQAHIHQLQQKKKSLTSAFEKEQQRSARSAAQGKKRYANDKLAKGSMKDRADKTQASGSKKKVKEDKEKVLQELKDLREIKKVTPRFHTRQTKRGNFTIQVRKGSVGYASASIVENINLHIQKGERISLEGANGSGKSTLMKGLLNDPSIVKTGEWDVPRDFAQRVGYIDQHYQLLDRELSIEDSIKKIRPDWKEDERKSHLNAYTFYDHRMHSQKVKTLSEGEKVRLSLAVIAADTPDFLILDEITNNLDMSTKEHLAEVLGKYEGAILINCHEESFLKEIGVKHTYQLNYESAAPSIFSQKN